MSGSDCVVTARIVGSVFQVGIKPAEVGSLVRQAPWLSLERIDGQMVPVVRFLRRAGVTDVERVIRAYPRILCASVRGELVPRVSDGYMVNREGARAGAGGLVCKFLM